MIDSKIEEKKAIKRARENVGILLVEHLYLFIYSLAGQSILQ